MFFFSFFLFVCFDMNAMYCILKGFSLYNFGNKFVFIVIVIVIVSMIDMLVLRPKGNNKMPTLQWYVCLLIIHYNSLDHKSQY